MKNKILLLLVLVLVLDAVKSRAQPTYVNTTNLLTNSISGGGYYISIPGFCTNAWFTTTNPVNIIVGDPLPTAFYHINTNATYLWTAINLRPTNNQIGVTLGGTFTGTGSFTNGYFTNGIFAGGTLSNSVITNSSLAGNGQYVTAINGANLTTGTVNSNQLDAATLTWLGTLGGGSANFIASPLAITAPNGELYLTAGTNSFNGYGQVVDFTSWDTTNNVGRGLQFQGYGGGSGGQFPVNFIGHGGDGDNVSVKFLADGDVRFDANQAGGGGKLSCGPVDFGIDFPGVDNGAFFVDTAGTGFTGINQPSPAYQLDVGGTFACDNGQIYSDGSGNLTAQTFNPVSDRAHKENIKPFDPQTALTMALALTNYTWRFKGATNTLPAVTKQTNSVAPKGFTLVTNTVVKIRPATGKEIGPMAQEWKAATGLGSGTNISLTSFNGLLLGAVQGLNQKLADPTRPNGTLYPSNTWSMAAITNGMADGGFWTGNSNGQALVSVNLSNGVVRIKQLAP